MNTRQKTFNDAILGSHCVVSIDLQWDDIENWYILTLVLGADDTFPKSLSKVRFLGVRELCLDGFGGGITQFNGLKLETDTRGFDGVRYQLIDHEDGKVKLEFWDFEIL